MLSSTCIIIFVLALVGGTGSNGFNAFMALYSLATLLPNVGVGVRRLHDIGRSGWWVLIAVVPVIGALVLLFFAIQGSQPGTNKWGPDPKGALS